jgi:serine/threonine-protein kinase
MRNESKRTLVGMTAPVTLPGGSPSSSGNIGGGFPPAPSSPSRMPPPPPGRGSLPPVGPGSAKTNAAAPAAMAQAKSNVDVDWDDDDEATQVFAEDATHVFSDDATQVLDEDKTRALPSGAAMTPAPMPAAGMPAAAASRPKATLLGLTAPNVLPPPNSRPNRPLSTPPPPPAGAFSRQPAFPGPSSYPPPPTINPSAAPPPAMPTQKGLGGMPPWGSQVPTPAPMPALAPPRGSGADHAHAQHAPPVRGMEATQMLQPRMALTPSRVAITIVAVAALVLGAVLFMPSKGKIVVNVSDSRGATVNRIDVFVDGEKTNCATAPCYLPYSQGTHEVKVVADGYDVPAPQAVVVKSSDPATVNFTLGSTSGSGIKVGGAQAGVKLYVDEKEVGPLPQIVRDLTPGDHTIRVAGSERYQPLERHVTVERDKLEDLGTLTLKVLKGKVTVSLGTSNARVFIVSGADRRELPMLPISVDIDTAKSWSLEGTKAGYDDYRQLISFDDGQAEKTYTVTLEPKSSGAPPQQAYAPAPQYSPPPSYQAAAPAPRPAPQSAGGGGGGGEASAGGGGGEAFLNINSIPPSTCILDGKSLGSTPRIHVSVKPGSHTVKFVDSDDGLTKTIFVNVGSGETKPAVAKLN